MKILRTIAGLLFLAFMAFSCDHNESAPIISDQVFSIEENSSPGTFVGTVYAFDPDEGQLLTFEIIDGNQESNFSIDPGTGDISVASSALLNYEEKREFNLEVAVNDNHEKQPLESSATVKINLTDVNEFAPVMNDQNFQLDENPPPGMEIGTVQGTDGDLFQHLSYQIISNDTIAFIQIDGASGTLYVSDPSGFDFETRPNLEVTVAVKDDHPNAMTDTAMISIQINNVFESTDHLLAYYPFDGNAMDLSGNMYHGTAIGPILTTGRNQEMESAYLFDGEDDYIELPPALALNSDRSFSIEAWVYKDCYTSDGKYTTDGIFGQSDGPVGSDAPHIAIFMYPDRTVRGVMRGTANPIIDLHPDRILADDQWHHIVLSRNANEGNLMLFINGELADESTFTLTGNTTSNDFVSIGAVFDDLQSLYHFFCGKIDMIRIFETALTTEQVGFLMGEN